VVCSVFSHKHIYKWKKLNTLYSEAEGQRTTKDESVIVIHGCIGTRRDDCGMTISSVYSLHDYTHTVKRRSMTLRALTLSCRHSVFYFVTLRLDKTLMIVDRSDYALPSVFSVQATARQGAFVKPYDFNLCGTLWPKRRAPLEAGLWI
jgi:hypothetical protein